MKPWWSRWRMIGGAMALGVPLGLHALSRTVVVDSLPQGAAVTIDGKAMPQPTPTMPIKLEFKSDGQHVVEVSLDGYETQRVTLSYEQAKAVKREPWRLPPIALARIRAVVRSTITSAVDGAEVSVNGQRVGVSPATHDLVFKRATAASPWSTNVVSAAKLPRFAADSRTVTLEDAERGAAGGSFKIELSPGEVQREVTVEIKANEAGADVKVDGVRVGVTPVKHTLLFKRRTAADPWPVQELRVEKEGFEHAPTGDPNPQPAFTFKVTADLKQGVIQANDLKLQGFVTSPVHFYDVSGAKVRIGTSNYLSQVKRDQRDDAPSPVSMLSSNKPIVLSRLSAVPGEPGNVVTAMPLWEERTGSGALPVADRIVGANIVKLTATGPMPITVGRYWDLDPFVTREWIYFSSDRTRVRIIWRVPVSGKGGYSPLTGTHTRFDTEPAVSPDETKLAYVSRDPDAPPGAESYVWMADADGTHTMQRWPGHHPSWSPDNRKIAYVSPDQRLAVVDVDSNTPVFLTDGTSQVLWPVWLNREEILYATDEGINGRGERNFDLWVRNLQAPTPSQKTFDGSFDSWPAVGNEGREVFFFSNRGAARPLQDRLQIYRIEFKTAAVEPPPPATGNP